MAGASKESARRGSPDMVAVGEDRREETEVFQEVEMTGLADELDVRTRVKQD